MKITPTQVKVSDLIRNYEDKGDAGVYGYNGALSIRPAFQREFVYKDKQREAVIDSVLKNRPLNVMYWAKTPTGYEVLDGQQRTISICQYVTGVFPIRIGGNDMFWHNITDDAKNKILSYELTVYICDGTDDEKLEWFRIINIAGETLTNQELLNATYSGTWLSDAKQYFSKSNCVAKKLGDGYLKANPIRQELLEKVLGWIAVRDGLCDGSMYMALHQRDKDAVELWQYYQSVINWAKMLFPEPIKGVTDTQDWGTLYAKYVRNYYNSNDLAKDLNRLLADDDVTKPAGIIPYLLSERKATDERTLSIRAFTDSQKRRAYERQNHICPKCGGVFELGDMEGDHITPWSEGGRTVDENLQMLCKDCNRKKGGI